MPTFKNKLAAPFPWFGGKVMQSELVWSRFGTVGNYVEPFAGSLGVLLNRPLPFVGVETVNDLDAFIVNFWRAVRHRPDELIEAADYPVTDLDMWSRHEWLIDKRPSVDAMLSDPEWCDPLVAGLWVWGICPWIGSGWCADVAHKKRSHTGNAGRGIQRASMQRSHTGNAGRGIQRASMQRSHTGNAGSGSGNDATYQRALIEQWVHMLTERLRRVRVLHGDWSRCVQNGVLRWGKITAIYFDPPYLYEAKRTEGLYSTDNATVASDVRAWCIENGNRQGLRIALAGYEGEHDMPEDWHCVEWTPHGHGYSAGADSTQAVQNVNRERVWFSPHCIKPNEDQLDMFQ